MRYLYTGLIFSLLLSELSWGAPPHASVGGGGRAPGNGNVPQNNGCATAKAGAQTLRAQLVDDRQKEKKIFPHLVAKLAHDEAYAKACRWFSETGQVVAAAQIEALAKKLEADAAYVQVELAKDAARAYLEEQVKAGRNPVVTDRVLRALLEPAVKSEVESTETDQLRADLIKLAQDLQSGRIKPEIPIQHEIKAWGPPGTAKFKAALDKEIAKVMDEYKRSRDFTKDVQSKLESIAVPMLKAVKLHQELGAYVGKNEKPKWNAADALKVNDAKKAWEQEKTSLEAHRKNAPGGAKPPEKEITAAIQKIGVELERLGQLERQNAVRNSTPIPKVTPFASEPFLRDLAKTAGISAAAVYHAVEQIRAARVDFVQDNYLAETHGAIATGEATQLRNYAIEAMKSLETSGKAKFDRAPNSDSFKESDVVAFTDYLKRVEPNR